MGTKSNKFKVEVESIFLSQNRLVPIDFAHRVQGIGQTPGGDVVLEVFKGVEEHVGPQGAQPLVSHPRETAKGKTRDTANSGDRPRF